MMIFQGGCFVYGGSTDQQKGGDRMPFITIWFAHHLQIIIVIFISFKHPSNPHRRHIVIIVWGLN